ncbi:hypothetical protein AcW1_000555 [Taiwanofungus camphoratus]|nr:hypothetical protein AcV7_000572 [Antrodia cinnamomea]KAI0963493.1 hypothetical protein AcW1_000555 [Antrodia cinnamomea]
MDVRANSRDLTSKRKEFSASIDNKRLYATRAKKDRAGIPRTQHYSTLHQLSQTNTATWAGIILAFHHIAENWQR